MQIFADWGALEDVSEEYRGAPDDYNSNHCPRHGDENRSTEDSLV